ncbi:hypothetical protein BG000_005283 [Podila horticola]|nr:hypothetical protein BG000_005283 [Podila horticola]
MASFFPISAKTKRNIEKSFVKSMGLHLRNGITKDPGVGSSTSKAPPKASTSAFTSKPRPKTIAAGNPYSTQSGQSSGENSNNGKTGGKNKGKMEKGKARANVEGKKRLSIQASRAKTVLVQAPVPTTWT